MSEDPESKSRNETCCIFCYKKSCIPLACCNALISCFLGFERFLAGQEENVSLSGNGFDYNQYETPLLFLLALQLHSGLSCLTERQTESAILETHVSRSHAQFQQPSEWEQIVRACATERSSSQRTI